MARWGVAVCALATGCATICSRSVYDVRIESRPPGAEFVVRDAAGRAVASGETPLDVRLPAARGYLLPARYDVSFSRAGCLPDSRRVYADLDLWALGDLLLPGSLLWFLGVDGISGAMWRLPPALCVPLDEAPAGVPGGGDAESGVLLLSEEEEPL